MEMVTCISVGVYQDNLTRGKQYALTEENGERHQVHIKGDQGRLRWFPSFCFDFENNPVSHLVSWQFDNDIESDAQTWMPEALLALSDGSRRFCLLATPQTLAHLVSSPGSYFSSHHLVVVCSYDFNTVDKALHHLDASGCLAETSLLIVDEDVLEGSQPEDRNL